MDPEPGTNVNGSPDTNRSFSFGKIVRKGISCKFFM